MFQVPSTSEAETTIHQSPVITPTRLVVGVQAAFIQKYVLSQKGCGKGKSGVADLKRDLAIAIETAQLLKKESQKSVKAES